MTSAYPAIGDCAVTAAAMRAAAAIIEESALPGLSITCTSREITVQVSGHAGDPAGRAAQVGRLARIAGTQACRDDSQVTAYSQIKACGQARGIPVTIFTPLEVRTQPGSSGPVPLAAAPGGQVTAVPTGNSRTDGGGSPNSMISPARRPGSRRWRDDRQDHHQGPSC